MRHVLDLLTELRRRGVRIQADGDQLRLNARPDAITDDLKARITANKPELLEMLRRAQKSPMSEADRIERRQGNTPWPLSFAQKRLWAMDRLGSKSMAYVTQVPVRLEGRLNLEAWRQSLAEFVRRHEILRSTVTCVDDEPRMSVRLACIDDMPLVDLRSLPKDDKADLVRQLIADDAGFPFDLAQGPLVRFRLLWVDRDDYVLLMVFHHIVADGWTLGVMAKELLALYEAYLGGVPSPLPELPLQFSDYALWQRDRLNGARMEELTTYWTHRLSGLPPLLDLPTDRPRPDVASYRGASLPFTLPKDLDDALTNLANTERVSRFMVLLAAFNALLHRYTNTDDIAVGSVVANRSRSELEDLVGCFINTIVLRNDLSGDPTFQELLQRCRQTALDAFDHQELPFDKLVELMQPRRSLSHSPLFQVMMLLQNAPLPQFGHIGLDVSALNVENNVAPFDLSFSIFDEKSGWAFPSEHRLAGENWLGTVIYSTDLFDRSTIERILRQFRQLLLSITEAPDARISRLRIFDDERPSGPTAQDGHALALSDTATIHRRFEEQVRKSPDAIAVSDGGAQWSYRALNRRANQLARHLCKMGVGAETCVGLYLDRGPNLIIAMLAVLKASGAYVPLDPALKSDRTNAIIADAGLSLVLTADAHREALVGRGDGPSILSLDDALPSMTQEMPEDLPGTALADNLAYVIYTSGSTGRPKGVGVSHANVAHLMRAARDLYDCDSKDTWSLFHSAAFDFSVWEIWGALLQGGRLAIVSHLTARDPEAVVDLIARERVTMLNQTPSAFTQLANVLGPEPQKHALRHVVFGGERLDPSQLDPWFARHGDGQPRLTNMYGITETTVHVTHRRMAMGATDTGRSLIGAPIPGTHIHLIDPNGGAAPVGTVAEIHVSGDGLARGYLNRPAMTADAFVPNAEGRAGSRMYRSGDLGRRLSDGDLEYLGRRDDQVKIRGYRIEPGEVEACLRDCPGVREAVVIARASRDNDVELVAYTVASSGQMPSAHALFEFMSERVPGYMVPSAFIHLDALPLTPNGKLNRAALLPVDAVHAVPDRGFEAPANELETYLAEVSADILGLDAVSVADNFFEIGGHSLLAAKLITRVRSERQLQLSLRVIFKHPTIREMAKAIAAQSSAQQAPVAAIPRAFRAAYSVSLKPDERRG
ncbi:non-ribosomal peptide synthetase [Roseivivax sp. CAU 1753]